MPRFVSPQTGRFVNEYFQVSEDTYLGEAITSWKLYQKVSLI
jgi:hypothetical protein